MAYNISAWTTKKIEGLVIPLSALYDLDEGLLEQGWQPALPVVTSMAGGVVSVEVRCTEASFILGGLPMDETIAVTGIKVLGEASGGFYHDILLSALKQSTGELEAVLVWEGGDSISRLVVKDGVVSEIEIEL